MSRGRVPQGVYKPCRGPGGCGGKGWKERTPTGRKIPHAPCGGDGWVKVGQKRSGRRRGGGVVRRKLRAAANNTMTAGAMTAGGYAFFGSVGAVVVLVVVALMAFLAVHRAVAGAGW